MSIIQKIDITPSRIRKLVELAFVIEPLLEKTDCTTRYWDIPGKTIYDFIISGLNVGQVFEDYAASIINDGNNLLFSHFEEAVSLSNEYKHQKWINLGLVEFMFVAVKARIISPNMSDYLNVIKRVVIETTNEDIQTQFEVHTKALSTSQKSEKKSTWTELYQNFLDSKNLYEYYSRAEKVLTDKTKGNYQVAHEHTQGFPILREYINDIDEEIGIIKSIEATYNRLHKEKSEIKIGILADFSAIALFVYLSYQDPQGYILK